MYLKKTHQPNGRIHLAITDSYYDKQKKTSRSKTIESLTISRILEYKLNHKYCSAKILESLSKSECSLLQQNYYAFDYYDDVLKDIGSVTGIDFSKRIRSLGDIKNCLAETKK